MPTRSTLAIEFALGACSRSEVPPPTLGEGPESAAPAVTYDLEIPQVRAGWDPGAGDPAVAEELVGPGFTGEGRETRMEFPAVGVPEGRR